MSFFRFFSKNCSRFRLRRFIRSGLKRSVFVPPRRRFLTYLGGASFFISGCVPPNKSDSSTHFSAENSYPLKRGALTIDDSALQGGVIRPAGVQEESDFLVRCIRCGLCFQHCPTGILIPLSKEKELSEEKDQENNKSHQNNGEGTENQENQRFSHRQLKISALGTPILDFQRGWCPPDCRRCAEVCPTGAIPLLSPEEKESYPLAKIRFHSRNCFLTKNKECSLCRNVCPRQAITFVWDEEEYVNIPTINPERCNGCGRCVLVCR